MAWADIKANPTGLDEVQKFFPLTFKAPKITLANEAWGYYQQYLRVIQPNKPGAFATELLQRKGLARHFQVCFGGDAFARKKPDPLPLLKTCDALGTAPARTLMLGDSRNDAQAARAAGCPVVLVSYGYNHGEPVTSAGADRVIDRLDQL